jgi:hypothetical protein
MAPTPKPFNKVGELTREEIADLFFKSLGNLETRKTHVMLSTATNTREEIGNDFKSWYGGVVSIVRAIEPDAALPGVADMVNFVTQNPDRVRAAIAAAA